MFASLPPEVNSGRMYTGPGAESMLVAASAWDTVAGELYATAVSVDSMIRGLISGPWLGATATAMAAAAASYVAWLKTTAAQAEQAAAQARAAAAAYLTAHAMTVPPALVAANRAQLESLIATDALGQNAPAIAATEAQYGEMWAQDAAAMYGYAGASAQATTLTPFPPALPTVNLAGVVAQANAVAQAVSTSAPAQGMSQITKSLLQMAGMTNEAPWLTNPLGALGLVGHTWNSNGDGIVVAGALGDLLEGLTGSQTLDASSVIDGFSRMVSPTRLFVTVFKDVEGLAQAMVPKAAASAAKAVEGAANAAAGALPAALPSAGLGGIAGAVGKAASVGGLAVPASWANTVGATNPIVTISNLGAAAAAEPAASAFGGMPVMPGSGVGRGMAAHFAAPRYGFKPTVVPQPPAGG